MSLLAIGISSISKTIPVILKKEDNLKNQQIQSISIEQPTKVPVNLCATKLETSSKQDEVELKNKIEPQINSVQVSKIDVEPLKPALIETPKTKPVEIQKSKVKVESEKVEEEIKQKIGEIVKLVDEQIKEDVKPVKSEIQQDIVEPVESQIENSLDGDVTAQ